MGKDLERMTKQQIADIRARCEAATPGNWYKCGISAVRTSNDETICETKRVGNASSAALNAKFISCARQDIPALLDYVKELQDALEAAHNIISHNEEDYHALQAECNQYKARAEALERAIKEHAACATCARLNPDNYTCPCAGLCAGRMSWQFDIERFAGKESQ